MINKVIRKYVLYRTAYQMLSVPVNAELLKFDLQVGEHGMNICAWMLVDPTEEVKPVDTYMFMTGEEVKPSGLSHMGTVLADNTRLVLHFFWRK